MFSQVHIVFFGQEHSEQAGGTVCSNLPCLVVKPVRTRGEKGKHMVQTLTSGDSVMLGFPGMHDCSPSFIATEHFVLGLISIVGSCLGTSILGRK